MTPADVARLWARIWIISLVFPATHLFYLWRHPDAPDRRLLVPRLVMFSAFCLIMIISNLLAAKRWRPPPS